MYSKVVSLFIVFPPITIVKDINFQPKLQFSSIAPSFASHSNYIYALDVLGACTCFSTAYRNHSYFISTFMIEVELLGPLLVLFFMFHSTSLYIV